uniref:Ovule protein n=1 Tax=Ascaris lumbricoides TaxID=6252 RepID=A0A0M3IF77_ASCLU
MYLIVRPVNYLLGQMGICISRQTSWMSSHLSNNVITDRIIYQSDQSPLMNTYIFDESHPIKKKAHLTSNS